jgi:hypothetical protein
MLCGGHEVLFIKRILKIGKENFKSDLNENQVSLEQKNFKNSINT